MKPNMRYPSMKHTIPAIITVLALVLVWSCDISETDSNAEVESSILSLITADDSSFGIDGMEDMEDEEYVMAKAAPEAMEETSLYPALLRDSTSIWRYSRRNMSQEREVTVEVETDSSAVALITHHITGTFHVRQFERVWTSDSTWERGDSIRFSQKAIDMTVNRRVSFRIRTMNNGDQRWRPVSMALAYGSTGNALDIMALEWVAEDSVVILDNFDTQFYDREHPLILSIAGQNRANVRLVNDTAGEGEMVKGNWGYHPRLNGPDLRRNDNFHYVETLDNGEKLYSRGVQAPNRPHRQFRGSIQIVDFRTLFDHDAANYSGAILGFNYLLRPHLRD